MKKISTYLNTAILILGFTFLYSVSKADSGKAKSEKSWTRWELSPVADIYYRVEVTQDKAIEASSKTISVEFLNNYNKEVSFCFAINDNGTPEVSYKPVMNLRKKKTTVLEYPKPVENSEMKLTITSLELGK